LTPSCLQDFPGTGVYHDSGAVHALAALVKVSDYAALFALAASWNQLQPVIVRSDLLLAEHANLLITADALCARSLCECFGALQLG
jgi:hypothetical protein